MAVIEAAKTLDHMQRVAVGAAPARVQPTAISQTIRLHDEGVVFPPADRIPKPRWLANYRQRASVGVHLTKCHVGQRLVQKSRQLGRLQDTEWRAAEIDTRRSGR